MIALYCTEQGCTMTTTSTTVQGATLNHLISGSFSFWIARIKLEQGLNKACAWEFFFYLLFSGYKLSSARKISSLARLNCLCYGLKALLGSSDHWLLFETDKEIFTITDAPWLKRPFVKSCFNETWKINEWVINILIITINKCCVCWCDSSSISCTKNSSWMWWCITASS